MSSTSYCVPVEVEVEQSAFTANELAIGLAFFFGVIFGVVLLLICAKLCLKDFSKKKRQDAEEALLEEQGLGAHQKSKINYHESRPNTAASNRAKSAKKRLQSAKKRKGESEPLVPVIPVTLIENTTEGEQENEEYGEGGKNKGIVDALVKPTPSAMEVEMIEQDVDAVNALERELKEESIMTMIQLMRTLLGQQMQKGKLSQDQYKDIMKDAQDNVHGIIKQVQTEKEEEEEEIKRTTRDPKKRQEELDKLHGKYMNKMNSLLSDEKEKLRKELGVNTDLSDKEIDALLAMYGHQMAALEHKLGVERARQAASLEERLARRKQLVELQNMETEMQKRKVDHQRGTNEKMIQHLIEKGALTDKQKNELLRQYDEDVNKLNKIHELEYERQKLSLAEKLKRNREAKMRALKEQQEKEQENFLKQSDKITGTGDLVEGYHDLMQGQRGERDHLSDELDKFEAAEIMRLKKEQEAKQQELLNEAEDKFSKGLNAKGVSQQELDRLLRIHEQEMQEFERIKKEEKRKMKAKLEEKLAQRRMQAQEEQTLALAESQAVKQQQDATIKKVLDSQVELTPDDREHILKEHDTNMTAINNQIQMSKLRQKKAMEAKLAARKTKLDDLKRKQDDLKMNRQHLKEKEKEKLTLQLEKQIAEEEARLDTARREALNDLRKSIAAETEQALSEQEKQMGVLIARLQLGQARRQAVINKQDKTIKQLEEKLAKQVDNGATKGSNKQVDYLLEEHYRQVSDLNTQLQDVKERQDHILREKIESKKLMKEREVEEKLETEAQEEWHEQKKRGALISTSILSQVMLENRHKMEIKRLEQEMQVEMQKQREKLNDELEEELQRELQERKKSFLAQVAAISNMSKDDVNDMVDNVVEATGGDDRQAKQLRKEFNQEVKKAKNQYGVKDDHRGAPQKRNNYGYENDAYENHHQRSGRQHEKYGYEEDDMDYHQPRSGNQYRGSRMEYPDEDF